MFVFLILFILAIAFSSISSIVSLEPDHLVPTVNITCAVVDSGVFEWIWTHRNNFLKLSENNNQMFISDDTQSSTLQINNLDLQDSGTYTCTVRSPMDEMKENEKIISLLLKSKYIAINLTC